MKVFAVNASPRKNMNTSALLESFLSGASFAGAETKIINLYDYNFKGCIECYGCKLLGGASYGKCAARDEISPVLAEISDADIVVFGSPIFFADVSGELRSFMERLLYPYSAFIKDAPRTIAPKNIRTAFIYTMNADETVMEKLNYPALLQPLQNSTQRVFGYKPEVMYSCFTYQYKDYSKYACSFWDESKKREHHETQFKKDVENAFELGKRMVSDAANQ